MKNVVRHALAVATLTVLGLASTAIPAAAGTFGGGGGGGVTITVGSIGTLSSDGNAVTLAMSFSCMANPFNTTTPFQGFVNAQLTEIEGKDVAFGGGGTFIANATCDGTTVTSLSLVVNPNVFGGSASPPFKPGKAIAQAGGNFCQFDSSGFPVFCVGGGSNPTLVALRH